MVTVVVVTYNAADKVRECLEAVTGFAAPAVPHEIVVLDNASTPPLTSLAREYLPAECVVGLAQNIGFARGCNAGAARARGRYVVFLNPDAVLHPGAVDRLVAVAESDPRIGVLGGSMVDPDGRVDPKSCWGAPSLWSYLCFATGISALARGSEVFDPEALGGWGRDTARDVPVVTGCLMLVRRALWDQLGGFDPQFFMYGEDADLCLRALRSGHRVRFEPAAVVLHYWGASSGSSGAKTVLLLAGRMTYLCKHFPSWRRPVGRVLLEAGVALRSAAAVVARKPDNGWRIAWGRRAEWRAGYPEMDGPTVTSAV